MGKRKTQIYFLSLFTAVISVECEWEVRKKNKNGKLQEPEERVKDMGFSFFFLLLLF